MQRPRGQSLLLYMKNGKEALGVEWSELSGRISELGGSVGH